MADNEEVRDKNKAHRLKQSGVKAEKKKRMQTKKENQNEDQVKQKNPKAFAINSAQRAERNFRRKEDLTAKKQHIPVVDQTPDEPPPMLIGVVGPPKVGKSTLIKNLMKNFAKTNATDIHGPVTIVTSKKRRITLLECNNDINSMIDVAKCADLILLMCDASYGFEMEIFEFLNICQVHGMPKMMGVLTHLDLINNPSQLRKRKKELKHRFWTEVYDGAKLFYLSGLLHGDYLKNEIKNLGRFISVLKLRPLQWRGAHSYVLVDRVEDVTNTEMIRQNAKCDREVILYGYVRGVPLKPESMVHIAGLGDLRINELNMISDPCPLPGREKKRNLLEKERLVYAPMSGVSGIVYDKDAVYIELQGSHKNEEKSGDVAEQNELLEKLIKKKQTVDDQINEQEFRVFSDGAPIKSKNFEEDLYNSQADEDIDSDTNENDEDSESEFNDNNSDSEDEQHSRKSDSDSETDDENNDLSFINANMSWKENLVQRASDAYISQRAEAKNLMRLVYQSDAKSRVEKEVCNETEDSNQLGDLFAVVSKNQSNKEMRKKDEYCLFNDANSNSRNWLDEQSKELLRNCFVTGKWKASEDAENLLNLDNMSNDGSELYGDFEDFETGEKHTKASSDENEKEHEEHEKGNGGGNAGEKRKPTRVEESNLTKSELLAKKMKLKAKFDAEYDDREPKEESNRIEGDHQYYESLKSAAQQQSEMNKNEFSNLDKELRTEIEGFRAGLYVRLGFRSIPAEFMEYFDPSYPVLIGSLNLSEENIGYVHCKVKKHRWYKKILKTGNPLIISLGWRRFQTVPIYSKVEDNFRYRYLKYTPEHVMCNMTFWGPVTPQNTGFLALQGVNQDSKELKNIGFRIAATGSVNELDNSTQIMKKLKLVGHPFKIYHKSAFIKGMFNTTLEVAKFEGAKIKTVSGIRGQIKKAHHTPEGSFRATFEDKILLSDIVFCRTWFRVDVPRFYTPVVTLLLSPADRSQWEGMKTLGQLKREKQIRNEMQLDSLYTEIKREPKIFKPMVIPKALQRALPYKNKPRHAVLRGAQQRTTERVSVVDSPHEQRVTKIMRMVEANYKERRLHERQETKLRLKKFHAEKQLEQMQKLKRQKELRKKVSRAVSKMRSKKTA